MFPPLTITIFQFDWCLSLLAKTLNEVILAKPRPSNIPAETLNESVYYTLRFLEKLQNMPMELKHNHVVNREATIKCLPVKALIMEAVQGEHSDLNSSMLSITLLSHLYGGSSEVTAAMV